ncbi:DUF7916 family protein [Amphibacillus sp. Q70]|uniref:DUF7916 family protein n=1 Tax=Amphibacillus sp. Q70 TaxID=3453416 RepID=UPI003F86F2FE
MKRLLNCHRSDFEKMTAKDLLAAIDASEGRVVLSETVASAPPLYPGVSNQEIVARFGADLILLNVLDLDNPKVVALDLEYEEQSVVERIKQLTGRPVGVNLEPVDLDAIPAETLEQLPTGRIATEESLAKVRTLGLDFVCLTGNPATGVTNEKLIEAIKRAKQQLGSAAFIIAGKMHGAGVKGEAGAEIINQATIDQFIDSGANVVLLPSPGTVPGITVERAHQWVKHIHQRGALAMLAIGTSQEGASTQTIEQIALQNKMIGADIHHIGDAGMTGLAIPENITAYSIAIRGKRHTYIRMSSSSHR